MLVVYLVFTEGYAATSGKIWIRRQLCEEAIRLGRLLCELIPRNPELRALLALMLLHDSRRMARAGPDDEIITLGGTESRALGSPRRSRKACRCWNRLCAKAPRAFTLCRRQSRRCMPVRNARKIRIGRRSRACTALCFRMQPSPVVELNRAAAIAMAEGPSNGLALIDQLEAKGELAGYHLLPAARADLLRRDGRFREAAEAYRRALALVSNDPERRYLTRRLAEVEGLQ
jgi:RNA polymerase sigma-70 factor (ECF subfamily)